MDCLQINIHIHGSGALFPRVLGHYVRDIKLFSLEEAVRKMTSLPAACFGLNTVECLNPGIMLI
ncbi:MAG: hypothetical protein Ct9H300mP28_08600 [Pseudomonadota bacterium]|nr:MAG: hypothetical protein Ct9H300mP28_08600 [Pseudomonadota bacterium]